jgi:hypothetical protein
LNKAHLMREMEARWFQYSLDTRLKTGCWGSSGAEGCEQLDQTKNTAMARAAKSQGRA